MSLQVWLPLNGDLHNQGLSNYNISIFRGTETYNNNGKIGKCFYANGVNTIKILDIIPDIYNYTEYSLCAWFYIEGQNSSHSGSAVISAGNWNQQLLNLSVSDWSADHYTKLRVSGINWNYTYSYNFLKNIWYHVVVCSDGQKTYAYVNGILIGDSVVGFLPTSIEGNDICIGGATYYSGMQFFGRINDVRIYNHCLSVKEVEEISKGLILHYKLSKANNNLAFNVLDLSKWSKESGVTATWDDTVQMFKVQDTSHTSSRWGIYQQIDCLPNTTYTFSVDGMKVNNTSYIAAGSSVSGAWPGNGSAFTTTRTRLSMTFTTGSDHTKIRMYLALYPTDGGTNYTYFANPKLEFGSDATDFISENFNNNIIEDSSGYKNNGWLIDGKGINDSPRYKTSLYLKGTTVDSSSNTITGAQYFYGKLSLSASSALTVSWWGNNITYSRGGIFETTAQIFDATNGYYGTDYNTTAIANWDSTFGIYNGSTRINIFSSFKKDSIWHHHVIVFDAVKVYYYCDGILITSSTLTGTLPAFNGIRMGLGRAGGVYRQIEQKVSDLRIYATALTAEQIKELYDTSAAIDKSGNIYAREVIE